MHIDLARIIQYVQSHNVIFSLGVNQNAKELLSFCFEHGLKIDAFIQQENESQGANFFGVPVISANNVPNAENCGFLINVGDANAANTILNLQRAGIYDYFLVTQSMIYEMIKLALAPNSKLKDAADSERCFLLCTGPSVLTQDLTKLKNEVVFSCSYTTEFESYGEISPQYYVTPSALNDMEDLEYIIESFRYWENKVTSPVMFMDYNDRTFLKQYGFLQNKQIYWVMQNTNWQNGRQEMYDLTGNTPLIWTASVMMIKIAMYMGYKKIYLLGTDHSSNFGKKGEKYPHAYDTKKLPERLKTAIESGSAVQKSARQSLYSRWQTFDEYFHLHKIAEANGIEIYNAAPGSELDEFPKVEYESLFYTTHC